MAGRIVRAEAGGPSKATGRETDGRFDFFVFDVDYLTGPPLHIHAVQEDTFYVVDGVLTVQLDDEVVELGVGDYASAPPGVPHTLDNLSANQTVRFVNVMTPGIGFDTFLEQLDALEEAGDMEAIERVAGDYGVTIVGPPLGVKLGLSSPE